MSGNQRRRSAPPRGQHGRAPASSRAAHRLGPAGSCRCPLCIGAVDAFLATLMDTIEDHGHAVYYGDVRPPVAYTVGLCAQDLYGYEIAMSGFPYRLAASTLNKLAEVLPTLGGPSEGLEIQDVINVPLRLRQATMTSETQFGLVSRVYAIRPAVWQAMWPDEAGLFPGEPGGAITDEGQIMF